MVDMPHVVMAEDDEGHATLVRRNLKRAGLPGDLVHLKDGQELLDYLYRRGPYASRQQYEALALILDLNMPRLGGFDVLRHLKKDDVKARIPVFVLTTTDNPTEIDRCYTLGAAACLVKPVEYAAFAEMVKRLAEFLMTASLPREWRPEPNGR